MSYDITSYYPGTVQNSDLLLAFRAPRNLTIDGGIGVAEFKPTVAVVCPVTILPATARGTVTVNTNGTTTWALSPSSFSLNLGDRIEIKSPASGNAGLGNLALTMTGEENPVPTATQQVYDLGGFWPDKLPAGIKIIGCLVPETNILVLQGLGNVRVAPSAGTITLNVLKNTTVVGTVKIETSGLVTVTISVNGVNFVTNDILYIQVPLPSGIAVGADIDSAMEDLTVNFQALIQSP